MTEWEILWARISGILFIIGWFIFLICSQLW